MRFILVCLLVVALAQASKDIDEELLVPHALDAAETSDREILESLHEDEETTKPTFATSTTTAATTTTASTTTARPLPTYSPETTALLREFKFRIKRVARAGYGEKQARRLVHEFVEQRERRKVQKRLKSQYERESKLSMQRMRERMEADAEERRLKREEQKLEEQKSSAALTELESEAKRIQEQDYVPKPLKKVMRRFGFSVREAEAKHESVNEIENDVEQKAKEEETKIAAEYQEEAGNIINSVGKEFETGLKAPLDEARRVIDTEKSEALKSDKKRSNERRMVRRVVDQTQRSVSRIRRNLLKEEDAIEQRAIRQEHKLELAAVKEARKLRERSKRTISKALKTAQKGKERAFKVAIAASNWFQQQEVPALHRFEKSEEGTLKTRLDRVRVKAEYKLLQVKEKLNPNSNDDNNNNENTDNNDQQQ